ncbi:MAG: 16S rRNA (guanine(527)-N(7))-methyltransferase RsmG [Candidatus Promineifilaceae bacterium]
MQALEALESGAAKLGLALSPAQLDLFGRYQALLLEWNRRLSLLAVTGPAELQLRHFLDALSCSRATGDLNGQRLADVGSGAGLPGIPLKILYPDLRLTLIESVRKKAAFLEAAAAELALTDVSVLAERAEAVGRDPAHREGYDWAVARAVAGLPALVEYLLPLAAVGGHALAMKGPAVTEEVAAAERAIRLLGGGEGELLPLALPAQAGSGLESETMRSAFLVVIDKVNPTPAAYPRRVGLPAKRPLR